MRGYLRWSLALWLTVLVSPVAIAAPASDKHDCSSSGELQPGPAPALSILEVDYGAFLYPRTLPLKASATDTDLLTVSCEACDGSEAQLPISDDVHPGDDPRSGYRWVLSSGEGSLNGPYDVRPVTAAQITLDKARTTLERHRRASKDANELVEAAQTVVNAVESRRSKLAERLVRTQDKVAEISKALSALQHRAQVAEMLLRGPEARLEVLRSVLPMLMIGAKAIG